MIPAHFKNLLHTYLSLTVFFSIIILLSSCSSTTITPNLAEIDVNSSIKKYKKTIENRTQIKPKSDLEIRKAYTEYLENTSPDDNSRVNALNRLAELEFIYSTKLLKEQESRVVDSDDIEDRLYEKRLDKTIHLLSTSLRDYPGAQNNDVIMYQLAKALDQKGEHQQSIDTLNELVESYPKSPLYVEVQFRIAEDAFTVQDYSTAEYSYTEVIASAENKIFYEKSLFKRGWARFKQQYYTDAIDDFLEAILIHQFEKFEKLGKAEREQFDEYFRAVSLAFSYLGGPGTLYDYFKDRADFKYTYFSYSRLSDIYLKQERFSDAVETHEQFLKHFAQSENVPYSRLKIIDIWKDSGFTHKIYDAIESFYVDYNPSSNYWKNQHENSSINRVIRRALKKYIILMSGFFHQSYQKKASLSDFKQTELWYQRYLKHYSSYAQNDKIYFLYAELLNQNKQYTNALKYYELAAYEDELIIHKDAAYASIIISDKLLTQNPTDKSNLKKHINYALKYSIRYPDSKRTQQLIIHAAELAFKAGEYKKTIELADIKFTKKPLLSDIYLASLKSESYFNLQDYVESESLYTQLIAANSISASQQRLFRNKLALSIYQQAKLAAEIHQTAQAINHYSRISTIAPASKIASIGLYDAIALNMQNKLWSSAIDAIQRFQKLYPAHELQSNVSKKLSVAYLSSNQDIKAAKEFEKISSMSKDNSVKAAALWQAAELYQQKNKVQEAIRSYETYVARYKEPYSQFIEAMNSLSKLSLKTASFKKSNRWLSKIVRADKKALNNVKTDRTKHLVSVAYLNLARSERNRFDKLSLSLPLSKSLKQKKNAMQSAVKLYAQSSLYKEYETTTEATYSIATIYKNFSIALLDSDRPANLNDEELDQYEILLEDKAFPFEDKAIEFFEINLARIQQGHFNNWIDKSRQKLIELFPVRYNRKPKQDIYIRDLH